MDRKRIVVFYHYAPGNEGLAKSDYTKFFNPLKNATKGILDVEPVYCPDVEFLINKLRDLQGDNGIDELYLHFSGHGNTDGIPYDNWLLSNNDFSILLKNEKVKFCFFSSCESSHLVEMANERKIPIVIGTLGDNVIENTYAIDFQIEFYDRLILSSSFSDAFEQAYVTLKDKHKKEFAHKSLVRGESGKIENKDINALQIVFSTKEDQIRQLVPSNFIREMENKGGRKPFLLSWFQEGAKRVKFRTDFIGLGYNERIQYLEIQDEELKLFKNPLDLEPVFDKNVAFLIGCETGKSLPADLLTHLSTPNIFKSNNYKIILGMSNTARLEDIIPDPSLRKEIPAQNIMTYVNSPGELFQNNTFIDTMEKAPIPAAKSREIVFKFNTKPVRDELIEMVMANKFIRVFFARIFNENLVHFLINFIRQKDGLGRIILVDNEVNRQMNLKDELLLALKRQYGDTNDFGLEVKLFEVYKDGGAIIVIRDRGDDPARTQQEIKEIINLLPKPAGLFNNNVPAKPTYLFFIREQPDIGLPADLEYVHLRRFSDPRAVDSDMVTEWKAKFLTGDDAETIVKEVTRISEEIKPENYMDLCPSTVIEFICEELKIPRKQIIGIN